jgi:hypothetical protein
MKNLLEDFMPTINEHVVLSLPKKAAFQKITSVDFMKALDSNFGQNTTILFQNERLMRSVSKVEGIGDIEIERITIPEVFTIITQRRQPMVPFIYQISLQILSDHTEGSLLSWINEFELDTDNKQREAAILSIIRRNDIGNLQNMQRQVGQCIP